jgi:hypothetical protein
MKPLSIKFLSAAALALVSLGVASAAQARSDVYFSIGVQAPGVYVQPAPVYVQPRPAYVAPIPAYAQSRPVYVTPRVEYRYDDEWRNRHGWRDGQARRHARLYGPNGDLDRDGIRNQVDRDRDGDGVRNRVDRFPDNPYRH